MTSKAELIKKVKFHFGLNIYESKVWVALLSKSIATVGEIAEVSGVPRSRVYDVLESLEKRGFAIAKLGKPVKYIVVKPAVVLEHMKNSVMRQAEERTKNLTNIRDSQEYKELETLYTKGIVPVQAEELSSAIRGRQNIYSHLKDLISNAKKEVVLVSTSTALKRKAHFLRPIFNKLKDRNISIRVAANTTVGSKGKGELLMLSKELGVPVRPIKINTRFCIVDNNKALVFITPDTEDEKDMAIWISSHFFSHALTTFLSPIWRAQK